MKQDLQTQIGWEIKAAKVEPVNGPVRIVYRWIEPNMNRDKDNISFGQKFVQDALVRMGILPDDGWKWVAEFEHQFSVDKRNPRVEIEIVEVSE